MRRIGRPSKVLSVLGAAALVAVATGPIASATVRRAAEPAPIVPTPLPSATAATRAANAYEESASTKGTPVPLVTVENTTKGPKITSHRVNSEAEARAVATEAARGNDLVSVAPDSIVRPIGAPTNDTYATSQWGLDRAKTTFTNAWNVTKGAGIIVAVIDTGVAVTNPDLKGQVLAGKAFLTGTTNKDALNANIDNCGHGTHVAGTIAALANNKVGVAGAAPGVKILPVKVLNCSGYSSDVANGVIWAAASGARVINLSLGGTTRDKALEAAITYARTKKVVVVAAAGNNWYHKTCNPQGNNAISYPGASPGVIGVGAIDSAFNRSCFSNVGTYVDLVAPGSGIISTYPPNLTAKGYAPYMSMSGTSMATPHVAAAAALVLARKTTCTSDQVEKKLENMAKRLGGTVGRNNNFGFGLVDPNRSVSGFAC